MSNNDQKFKVCGKVQSVRIDNCEIIVKLRPNYKDEYLLLEKEDSDKEMNKYKADKKEFFTKDCRILNFVTVHSKEQMTFTVKEEGDRYCIISVELIYG